MASKLWRSTRLPDRGCISLVSFQQCSQHSTLSTSSLGIWAPGSLCPWAVALYDQAPFKTSSTLMILFGPFHFQFLLLLKRSTGRLNSHPIRHRVRHHHQRGTQIRGFSFKSVWQGVKLDYSSALLWTSIFEVSLDLGRLWTTGWAL